MTFACGLLDDKSIVCWGDYSYEKLIVPQGTFSAVSAGGQHGCALRTDGTVACWGCNEKARW